jgi:hypothetical protein
MVFTLIALKIPLLKVVRFRESLGVITDFVGTGEDVLLPASDVVRLPACGYFAIPIFYADHA